MMFAIYYKDPETEERFVVCMGAKYRNFHPLNFDPTLYAQSDNARKVIRDWRRQDKGGYGRKFDFHNSNGQWSHSLDVIDYKNLEVVPIKLVPDFDDVVTGDKA